jgi:hypothetical protein
VLSDLLDEIKKIGDDLCTKYQITQIDGIVQIPSAIILKKNSSFYKKLNFAAASFTVIPKF